MAWILIIIGIIEIIEGSLINFFPEKTKELLKEWISFPDNQFRLPGVIILIIGIILVNLGLINLK
jgi:uncharacterized protein YjeT (DUF2065 family)